MTKRHGFTVTGKLLARTDAREYERLPAQLRVRDERLFTVDGIATWEAAVVLPSSSDTEPK